MRSAPSTARCVTTTQSALAADVRVRARALARIGRQARWRRSYLVAQAAAIMWLMLSSLLHPKEESEEVPNPAWHRSAFVGAALRQLLDAPMPQLSLIRRVRLGAERCLRARCCLAVPASARLDDALTRDD